MKCPFRCTYSIKHFVTKYLRIAQNIFEVQHKKYVNANVKFNRSPNIYSAAQTNLISTPNYSQFSYILPFGTINANGWYVNTFLDQSLLNNAQLVRNKAQGVAMWLGGCTRHSFPNVDFATIAKLSDI